MCCRLWTNGLKHSIDSNNSREPFSTTLYSGFSLMIQRGSTHERLFVLVMLHQPFRTQRLPPHRALTFPRLTQAVHPSSDVSFSTSFCRTFETISPINSPSRQCRPFGK